MEVKQINVKLIKPYWNNPRINDKTIKPLQEAIKKFGFLVPIVLDKDNVIISGHTRYKAASELVGKVKTNPKLVEINAGNIPCIYAEGLTDKQKKEFRISDNKISELSHWDTKLLESEIKAIGGAIGFSLDELNKLVGAGVKFDSYTKEDITKAEKDLNAAFQKLKGNLVEVTCPHCGEDFEIK